MNGKYVWVVKKNRIFYQNALNVGLKTHYHYCDDILYARFFDEFHKAKSIAEKLNEANAIDYIKGKWKVVEYNLVKVREIK